MTDANPSARYPTLFSPLRIGNVTVRNRLMQTAHGKLFGLYGLDSRRHLAYHRERAKGGIGLIITGNRLIHPTGAVRHMSVGYRREGIVGDQKITHAVHEHGAVIFAQLNHFGVNAAFSDSLDDLRVLWGPSAVKSPACGEVPKAMEEDDIREVIDGWARSAEFSREAGFDGVEIHLSHGYLLHEFLSPVFNKRTDDYGGSFDNRARLAREVIQEVRDRVGRDFVIGVRISLSDFLDGGLGIDDAVQLAQILEDSGLIDFIDTTGGGGHTLFMSMQPSDAPDGYLLDLAVTLKNAVSALPVFVVGGLRDPAQAEDLLATGKADMVAMTRTQIADPEFPEKVRTGREDEIYHCIRGNQGCLGRAFSGLPIACTVNPATGREDKFGVGTLIPAHSPSKWLVVGAGPAGMKAAEILARRGHSVTLLEREAELGGQVNLILRTPGRDSFSWLTSDMRRQLGKLGVDVRLGYDATADRVLELQPDNVIIATGAKPTKTGFSTVAPLVDALPGVSQDNVFTSWDVLLGDTTVGSRVVLLDDDGTRATAGVAEVLLDRGCDVELVSRFPSLFQSTSGTLDQPYIYRRLFSKGLKYRLNTWARSIDGRSVTVYDLYANTETVLPDVDSVVLASPPTANDALYFQLKPQVPTVRRIGDCVAPRKLDHAIYEGFVAGRELWTADDRYIEEGELERWD